MGDPPSNPGTISTGDVNGKRLYRKSIVASVPKPLRKSDHGKIPKLIQGVDGGGVVGKVAIFLLKLAALETVRRVSRSKCPSVWRGVQALQFLSVPPFAWIQKWAPFKGLFKGIQMFSRPLFVLSVATMLSDQSVSNTETLDDNDGSQPHSETHSETASVLSLPDTRTGDGNLERLPSENWLVQLHGELEKQGIMLPERINENELQRFYTAANGDVSCLLLSVKKTIRWRETFRILSQEELEKWSNMVFWHGFDVLHRPCLIVRLGLACTNLPSHERPRFAQAPVYIGAVSQVEHGILNLVDEENPQITVLVDCDAISPLRIPMQMMKSCSSLLQDNFPNRLGHLLVIRLPPVVRVIAQTFIQVLKPVTRKKLRIEGKMYHRVLSQYLETLPSYLGGNCTCNICSDKRFHVRQQQAASSGETMNKALPLGMGFIRDGEDLAPSHLTFEEDIQLNDNWDRLLRTAVIGMLMVWALIALLAGFHDPESRHLFVFSGE